MTLLGSGCLVGAHKCYARQLFLELVAVIVVVNVSRHDAAITTISSRQTWWTGINM